SPTRTGCWCSPWPATGSAPSPGSTTACCPGSACPGPCPASGRAALTVDKAFCRPALHNCQRRSAASSVAGRSKIIRPRLGFPAAVTPGAPAGGGLGQDDDSIHTVGGVVTLTGRAGYLAFWPSWRGSAAGRVVGAAG